VQKDIIDEIREKKGDFVVELKPNQRSLRYGIEDKFKTHAPGQVYTEGPVIEHGRIETRAYRMYDGLELIADKERWGGNLPVVEFEAVTVKKSTRVRTYEQRLFRSLVYAPLGGREE